jgi:long-chain acyl-CoA synthetase
MSKELTIANLFTKIAHQFPDKVCLQIERDGKWGKYTYAQTEELSRKVAAFLMNEGIGKGDFVLLMLNNSPEWAISYLGIVYSGACVVPLDPQLTLKEIENIAADCNPKAIFTSEEIFTKYNLSGLKFKFKKIIIVDSFKKEENAFTSFEYIKHYDIPRDTDFPQLLPEDNASLIYTSGTTGKPKGVLLSHYNFCSNVKSFENLKIFTKEDTFLSLLPLFHSYAFMSGLLVPLLIGASISYCPGFKPEDVARTVRESGVSVMPTVPQFLTLLRNKIFSKYDKSPPVLKSFILFFTKGRVRKIFGSVLRLFVSGGARLEPAIAKDISRLGIVLIEGYGLTETSPVVALNPPKKVKFGSVGKAIPDVKVKINSPDKSGLGEILIKGPNVMKGYYKRPDLTCEVIKDGWFYSGDLGYLDEEGYLFITGRLKEVIVLSSGKNIYPAELEEIYNSSPYIKGLCILTKEGQRGLHAVILPDFSYFRQTNIVNIQDKIKWELENISKTLPPHDHIMGFTMIRDGLPRTRLGKIKRFELQERYGKAEEPRKQKEVEYSKDDLALVGLGTSKKILSFLTMRLKRAITLDEHLEVDLGLDSLGRIELADGLERILNVKIPAELIAKVFTIRELLVEINMLEKREVGEEVPKKIFTWKELLNILPPDEVLAKLRLKAAVADRMFTLFFGSLFLLLLKFFWGLSAEGEKNLPKKGPYILCPNHASYLDGFIVGVSLPLEIKLHTFFLGHAAIFEHPYAAWGIELGRLIPLDLETHLTEVLQVSSYVLRNGKIMCIFPAGRRSIDENVQDFKKGVGILAKELNIPLVPVYIKGSHFAWPRGRNFPHPYPLKITYGHPLSVNELLERSKEKGLDEYERIVHALREEVIKLSNY